MSSALDEMDDYGGADQPRSDPSNLIVNYLPPTFTQEDLRRLFEPFGKIEKCKILVDRKGMFEIRIFFDIYAVIVDGHSLGYGFVKTTVDEAAGL